MISFNEILSKNCKRMQRLVFRLPLLNLAFSLFFVSINLFSVFYWNVASLSGSFINSIRKFRHEEEVSSSELQTDVARETKVVSVFQSIFLMKESSQCN